MPMNNITIDDLVKTYDLQPHPEGGFYKETYRAKEEIPASALPIHKGNRSFSTGIFFLLPKGTKSRLHRIKSDEMWHFYLGDPLTLIQISPECKVSKVTLGTDIKNGQKVQHTVPAGHWFGAYPNNESDYAFVGCTVAPGFDFADFEMGNIKNLKEMFPDATSEIEMLTD